MFCRVNDGQDNVSNAVGCGAVRGLRCVRTSELGDPKSIRLRFLLERKLLGAITHKITVQTRLTAIVRKDAVVLWKTKPKIHKGIHRNGQEIKTLNHVVITVLQEADANLTCCHHPIVILTPT